MLIRGRLALAALILAVTVIARVARADPPRAEPPRADPPKAVAPPTFALPLSLSADAPHGTMSYRPVRASVAPKIDGRLDDAIWQVAPIDGRFGSIRSKPYGLLTKEPTAVQVAYDERVLYVAFRCRYSAPGDRDDGVPPDEETLLSVSEAVAVAIDPRHDHANARLFAVGRTGARGDLEWTDGGATSNREWRGIWDAATQYDANGWTVEIAIPWGTLGMPTQEGDLTVAVNFVRREPLVGEVSFWALPPAGTFGSITHFGHLDGMSHIHPAQRLFLQPYLASVMRHPAGDPLPALRDFTGTDGNASIYGGLYARYRPPGPVQLDLTINPDFSTVTPDQAITVLDRFEPSYPELRPFFAEDRARFELGGSTSQLFYSRRVGLAATATGAYVDVPILYGSKGVVRSADTEVAVMNVGLTRGRTIDLADNVTVARLNHFFGHGRRLGNIFLHRFGDVPSYTATGMDGAYTFLDEHLTIAGFIARTATHGVSPGSAGRASVAWSSEDFTASLAYLDVGKAFDPQLGFFPLTGIRSDTLAAYYTPVIRNDLIHQIVLGGQIEHVGNRDETRVYDRVTLEASAQLISNATVAARVYPAVEEVSSAFTLAADRITVPAGHYTVMTRELSLASPPRHVVEGALKYVDGDLFGGHQRIPEAKLGLNFGRFTGSVLYQLVMIHYDAVDLTAHRVSARSTVTYTPLARTTLAVEATTFSQRATAQLVNAYSFGTLSTLALAITETGGADPTMPGSDAFSNGSFTAVLSFFYGMTPF
jgi:hypothetical protein